MKTVLGQKELALPGRRKQRRDILYTQRIKERKEGQLKRIKGLAWI